MKIWNRSEPGQPIYGRGNHHKAVIYPPAPEGKHCTLNVYNGNGTWVHHSTHDNTEAAKRYANRHYLKEPTT